MWSSDRCYSPAKRSLNVVRIFKESAAPSSPSRFNVEALIGSLPARSRSTPTPNSGTSPGTMVNPLESMRLTSNPSSIRLLTKLSIWISLDRSTSSRWSSKSPRVLISSQGSTGWPLSRASRLKRSRSGSSLSRKGPQTQPSKQPFNSSGSRKMNTREHL